MYANTPLKDIMTTDVIKLTKRDNLLLVNDLFRKYNIHHLPVVDEAGVVVGIVSKSDFYKLQDTFSFFNQEAAARLNVALFRSLLVGEVMTKQVATLEPDDTVLMAAGYFRENMFHAIPVVNEFRQLVGIITTYDLLNFAFKDERVVETAI